MKIESAINSSDIFGGCGNGTLHFRISRLLKYPSENSDIGKEDRTLDICFSNKELRAVNLEIFRIVTGKTAELEGYGIKNWGDYEEQIFSEFPMSKMEWTSMGIYKDALYNYEEVTQLLGESHKIKSTTSDSLADLAARKLIYSCNETLKAKLCLCMWCD
jgi:hypothetical protein